MEEGGGGDGFAGGYGAEGFEVEVGRLGRWVGESAQGGGVDVEVGGLGLEAEEEEGG